jgi:hypothetical protein
MAAKAQGKVSEVFQREWDGRNGTVILHSFQLEGSGKFYRTGTEQVVQPGQYVRFLYDQKGQVEAGSLEEVTAPVESPKPEYPKKPTGGSSGKPSGSGGYQKSSGGKGSENWEARAEYWDAKDQRDAEREKRTVEVVEPRITVASAQSDAVALVATALQHDLLSFGNANKGAKLGLLLGFVDQVTKRFALQRFNASAFLDEAREEDAKTPAIEKPKAPVDSELE